MATPTIPNGEEYFFPVIYSGNGQGQRVGKFLPFTDQATIAKSCMFNDGDSAYMSRTAGSSPTSTKQFTISLWVKLGALGTTRTLLGLAEVTGSTQRPVLNMNSSNQLQFVTSGGTAVNKVSNRTFEDTSKFYHILISVDTTQSTADNRNRIYVDGDEITSFATNTNPSQDSDYQLASQTQNIGRLSGSTQLFDGYLAEINYVDGQALLPASFGITDTSTGRWIPKTVEPFPTTTTDIAVTVVDSGGNKYALDGVTQGTVTLIEGATYKFDQSDSSNSGHPLRFSTTSNGTHGGGSEYTTGVTTVGTPGSSGAYTQITVATGAPTLYYYCSNHSGMGGTANTQNQYGSNGFRLQFGTDSALGDDTSGNTNDFTSSGLAASDQRTDTPTNNLPTMRPYNPSYNTTQAQGNLQYTPTGTNAGYPMCATLRPNSGKWYAEVRSSSNGGGNVITFGIYIQEDMHNWDNTYNYYPGGQVSNGDGNGVGMQIRNDGQRWLTSSQLNGTVQNNLSGTALAAGDVIGIAVDVDNSLVTWYANDGSSLGSASILRPGSIIFTAMAVTSSDTFNWNFGDNPTFDGTETAGGNTDADGNGNFYHSVPSGFKMLRQDNMPETEKGITGVAWMKDRDSGSLNHALYDSSRGVNKLLYPNTTSAELSVTAGVSKFLKGGYAVGDAATSNTAGDSFVTWNWVANGGTTASNEDGDISSTVQVNTTAGFSIVQYTGNGSSNQSIGHGLGVVPRWIMIKELSSSDSWNIWHGTFANTEKILLNSTGAKITGSTAFGSFTPTSSVFKVNGNNTNASSATYVAYCWNEIDGFSKFGNYTGNASTDGPFVYTGFAPAWVMLKRTGGSDDWYILDSTREPNNPKSLYLEPNTTNAEASTGAKDFLSNGFKIRDNNFGNLNENYIYMAFAEHPFVGDGTSPVTAR